MDQSYDPAERSAGACTAMTFTGLWKASLPPHLFLTLFLMPASRNMFFQILAASGKADEAKKAAPSPAPVPQLHLVPGAKPLTKQDYALFKEALKETPAGRWRHRHMHADASTFAKMV